tara:strand:+ start:2396 stop:2626 length:231 start_codon:yes stop_codon:yes gene_type:complete
MSDLVPDNTPDPFTLKMMEFTAKTNASMRKLGIKGVGGFINPLTGEMFCQSVDGSEIPEHIKEQFKAQLMEDLNND